MSPAPPYIVPPSRHAMYVFLVVVLQPGCFLAPKKKDDKGPEQKRLALIDRSSIFLDRFGEEGTSARLRFRTKEPATCKLAFYTQDDAIPPLKSSPTEQPCSRPDSGGTQFNEELKGWRTDVLYVVRITVWRTEQDNRTEQLHVKEGAHQPPTVGGGEDQDDGDTFQHLYIVRLNKPLKTAEVHRHSFASKTGSDEIRKKMQRSLGCQTEVPKDTAPFREAASDISIQSLTTKGYAAATSKPHTDYKAALRLEYRSFNLGDRWTFLFQSDDKDQKLNLRSGNSLLNVEMTSTETQGFDEPQLARAAEPLKIDPSKPLELAWTTDANLLDSSYFTVQIGRPGYEKAIYCVFDAQKKKAVVPSKLLENLADGKHVILTELESSQLWANHGWIVATYDWRAGRIEK